MSKDGLEKDWIERRRDQVKRAWRIKRRRTQSNEGLDRVKKYLNK